MCTALSYNTSSLYFGRNLDINLSYGEGVVITPRNYPFKYKHLGTFDSHDAIIGMGILIGNTPLYFDGANESGLSMAGLNFPHSYEYFPPIEGKKNITSYEIIPYVLTNAKSVKEARELLQDASITNESFQEGLPASPLHWIISDKEGSITVESTHDGLKIYDNPFGVLTNEPEFPIHMFNLKDYGYLSSSNPENNLSPKLKEPLYCLGLGAKGLPGDYTSTSRFIKTVFLKEHSSVKDIESENISQFFHILESVFFVKGSVHAEKDEEVTLYSSCINVDKGLYYYKTYFNSRISVVDMNRENLEAKEPIFYKLDKEQDFSYQN